jgi:hypothetical protein
LYQQQVEDSTPEEENDDNGGSGGVGTSAGETQSLTGTTSGRPTFSSKWVYNFMRRYHLVHRRASSARSRATTNEETIRGFDDEITRIAREFRIYPNEYSKWMRQ